MVTFELTHDIYTPAAIDASMQAFRGAVSVSVSHVDDHSVLVFDTSDVNTASEMLNYILGLSAQELLQN